LRGRSTSIMLAVAAEGGKERVGSGVGRLTVDEGGIEASGIVGASDVEEGPDLGQVERGREREGFNSGALSSRLPRPTLATVRSVSARAMDGPATKFFAWKSTWAGCLWPLCC
jgi:hypothetical protein